MASDFRSLDHLLRQTEFWDNAFHITIVLGLIIAFFWFLVAPVLQQFLIWLEVGSAPDRDGFWLVAPSDCPELTADLTGWKAKDACRNSLQTFTDMVGLNKIISFVMELNLLIIAFVTAVFGPLLLSD